ncbi:MAG: TolC family protein [Myxococcota bacterium]
MSLLRPTHFLATALAASMALASPAVAAELPASAVELLPGSWSTLHPEPGPASSWWVLLGGEELAALVEEATASNADLAISDQRLDQARARTLQSTSSLLPSVSLSGNWTVGPTTAQTSSDDAVSQGMTSLNVAVPLNLWTSLPSRRAATSDTASAAASWDNAAVATATTTARRWLDLVHARQRLDLIQTQIEGDTSILTLVEARYRTGSTSAVDVLQQRQQLASSRTRLPDAQAAVGRAERALSAHLQRPSNHPSEVTTTQLPPAPQPTSLPSPTELIAHHPRVVSSVQDYEASQARRIAARNAYLPSLSATASTGLSVTSLTDYELTDTWSVGLQASVPLFNGGRTTGSAREARSAERIALENVEQTVLNVVVDVEDALAIEAQRRQEVQFSTEQADAARAALTAARAEYGRGLSTYNTVLNALSTSKNADISLLSAQRSHLYASLDLIAMSGGEWVGQLEQR